jgi:tight adherence protein C
MNHAIEFKWYIILLIVSCWGIATAGFSWYVAHVARQISYVTLADGRRQERKIPLVFRLLLPLAPNLNHLFNRPVFKKSRQKLAQQITSAGYDTIIAPEEMLSLRVLIPLLLGPVWVIMIKTALPGGDGLIAKLQPAIATIGVLWLFIYPTTWLRKTIQRRHSEIRRTLPFVLDLLTLSVEAGMDFMSALQRNNEHRQIDALGEELIQVVREIQLGKTRRGALRDMALRVNLQELRAVVNALVQADELGVSIGSILRIQSDQIRQRRFERAEKLANEAPVKMLFPLLVFIFPSVFLILLGPIISRMFQQGF